MLLCYFVFLCLLTYSNADCPKGWLKFGYKCYHFGHDTEALPIAQMICRQMGGQIVEVTSAEENSFLASQTAIFKKQFWIGVDDIQVEGEWAYSESMKPIQYSNWAPGEPEIVEDQNCVALEISGIWIATTCNLNFNYICEMPQ